MKKRTMGCLIVALLMAGGVAVARTPTTLEGEPKSTREFFLSGHKAMDKGDELGVVDFFTRAKELATKDTDKAIALNNIGYFYIVHQSFDKAKLYLEQAAAYDKTNKKPLYRAKIWNNLGQVYEIQKDLVQALSCYRKACEADGTYEKPQINRLNLEKLFQQTPVPSKITEQNKQNQKKNLVPAKSKIKEDF